MALHDVLTSLFALMFILSLILCARYVVKALEARRGAGMRKTGTLAISERLDIDRTRRLTLVRAGNREVLLLTGGAVDVMLPFAGEARFQDVLETAEVAS